MRAKETNGTLFRCHKFVSKIYQCVDDVGTNLKCTNIKLFGIKKTFLEGQGAGT